ncbi:MFS transporter [Sphingomonas sp. Root720]|uniref:MFS transporter n=2 Tax=unclassified Sphingomonas TaxID=196159 RepID=UPI0006FDAEE0|nr:MFS transporter [Sphingomonas sp. Root720]KQX18646.1 MFS transporter [Sphingomonas sp. Root1294]KQY72031.1 MFS transporter [Sphingomonas sp. Root50]KRB94700.1 MFS transporter [Sphingomonas sp. Root720]
MALVVIGMQVFIIQPGLVSVLIAGGAGESIVGYAASAEIFGIALSTIAAASIGTRLSWKWLAGQALALMAGANLASAVQTTGEAFLLLRLLAGLGAGIVISLGYAMVGMAPDPDRSFGHLIIAVLAYGALGIFGLPAAAALLGTGGVFVLLALMAAAGLGLLGLVAQPAPVERPTEPQAGSRASLNMLLAAIFLFFLGQGVVWAFLSLIGERMGIAPQAVANGLTIAQLAGIPGAFAASLGRRIGHRLLIAVGTIGCVAPLAVMTMRLDAVGYGVGISIFNAAANLMTPLLVAIVAGIDRGGRLVQRAAALQMLGLAVGPALSTPLMGHGFTPILGLSILLFLSCWLLSALNPSRTGGGKASNA